MPLLFTAVVITSNQEEVVEISKNVAMPAMTLLKFKGNKRILVQAVPDQQLQMASEVGFIGYVSALEQELFANSRKSDSLKEFHGSGEVKNCNWLAVIVPVQE